MEAIQDEGVLWIGGQWFQVECLAHYAHKDFHVVRRTSPEHGWREVGELTREQVTELRDMLTRALEEWQS